MDSGQQPFLVALTPMRVPGMHIFTLVLDSEHICWLFAEVFCAFAAHRQRQGLLLTFVSQAMFQKTWFGDAKDVEQHSVRVALHSSREVAAGVTNFGPRAQTTVSAGGVRRGVFEEP